MHGEGGDVLKLNALDLAVLAGRLNLDQPSRGFEGQMRDRLLHLNHPGLEKSGHDANRVAARHGGIFRLLHYDETGVSLGVTGGHNGVAAKRWIAARFLQHQCADVVVMRGHIEHLLFDRIAVQFWQAGSDDTAAFTLGMGFNGCDDLGRAHVIAASGRWR